MRSAGLAFLLALAFPLEWQTDALMELAARAEQERAAAFMESLRCWSAKVGGAPAVVCRVDGGVAVYVDGVGEALTGKDGL